VKEELKEPGKMVFFQEEGRRRLNLRKLE